MDLYLWEKGAKTLRKKVYHGLLFLEPKRGFKPLVGKLL
jgi:hypothetical protein